MELCIDPSLSWSDFWSDFLCTLILKNWTGLSLQPVLIIATCPDLFISNKKNFQSLNPSPADPSALLPADPFPADPPVHRKGGRKRCAKKFASKKWWILEQKTVVSFKNDHYDNPKVSVVWNVSILVMYERTELIGSDFPISTWFSCCCTVLWSEWERFRCGNPPSL